MTKQECKHPAKDLVYYQKTEYDEDEYGSHKSWLYYFFECRKCSKKVEVKNNYFHKNIYYQLTDRRLNLDELKSLFKENNELFHIVSRACDYDTVVLSYKDSDKEKIIKSEYDKIIKHVKNYMVLCEKYKGMFTEEDKYKINSLGYINIKEEERKKILDKFLKD